MKRYLIASMVIAATLLRADPPPIMRGEDAERQNLLSAHPRPDYPSEARRKRIGGSGVFLLRFDYETGHLREVHVATSTGSPMLDAAVITTLKKWQAKPRSLHTISVPITFTFAGAQQ
jgi:TonB family protein